MISETTPVEEIVTQPTETEVKPWDIQALKEKLQGKPFEGFRTFGQFTAAREYWAQAFDHPDLGPMRINENQTANGTIQLRTEAKQNDRSIIVALGIDEYNVKDIRLQSFYD